MRRKILLFLFLSCAGIVSAQFSDSPNRGEKSTSQFRDSRLKDSLSWVGGDTILGLDLKEVEVLAQRGRGGATTSYLLNRLTLDHHQMLNVSGIAALLPGGKTLNPTLTDDSRLNLRSAAAERGNATFGTAIDIDGVRLDNNAMMDETAGTSTRAVSSSNIESVEVVTGIPSVEYGDVSNGVVKVRTRRGKSPFIFEVSTNPYTKQVSLNKGFALRGAGTLNFSVEHAQSFTSTTSPHTSYQRNALSVSFSRAICRGASTLNMKGGLSGNIGGYNSAADPDAFADTYQKVRDNQFRANLALTWILDLPSAARLRTDFSAAYSFADKLTENYVNKSSSSAQPMLHSVESGYFIAGDASTFPAVLLSPTGYWYELSFHDQKPQTVQLKAKCSLTAACNELLIGAEYKSSRNGGRGLYYDDLLLAPTWRQYRYDLLPAMENASLFAENRLSINRLQLIAGLREELVPKAVLSPRFNAKYVLPPFALLASPFTLNLHAGYGRSVKLPSFQILYPADSYLDKLAFTPGTTADNRAFYAFNTYVSKAVRNPALKWQSTDQLDIGAEAEWLGARLSVSFFLHKTLNPYQQVNLYEPVAYCYTSQTALESISIPAADRVYSIDRLSGAVTVLSATNGERILLPSTTHYTYNYNRMFVNGSPVTRYGWEWILDFPKLSLGGAAAQSGTGGPATVTLRIDGNYYRYRGLDRTLFAGAPNGVMDATDSPALIGYYLGSSATSASSPATPAVSSGTLSRQCNLNSTLTLHIPRVRFIATLRLESTLLSAKRQLTNASTEAEAGRPLYYSTWDEPQRLIPFDGAYEKAVADGDALLASALQQLVKLPPTDYYFRTQRLSSYYSCNLSLTKEIGSWLSVSFYANNFLNSMQKVRHSQTGLLQSLFNGGLIPKFYYGMSVRIKV